MATKIFPETEDWWPEPRPLPEARQAVAAFDPRLLPETLRPWVEDISDRLQCAPDYAAVGTMVALAAVVGRRIGICPKTRDDWLVVPNLWGGVVGRPGIMKTPALTEAMRPLRRLEAEEAERYEDDLMEFKLGQMLCESRVKALRAELDKVTAGKGGRAELYILQDIKRYQQENEEPICVRYETNDTTVEKLGELLAENPNGLLVFRDELVGWLRNLDKQGHEGSRAFFLEAWDGKSGFVYDRIGRGTVRIKAACVSLLGGIQPGPLAQYVRHAGKAGAGADGLLQRFQLLVYPDEPRDWKNVDRWPDSTARNSAFSTFSYLASMDAETIPGADTSGAIPFLRFDEAAQEAFTEWRLTLEAEKLRSDEPEIIEAHLSKYRSLVPSLALLCHLADNREGRVSEAAIVRAAMWGDYLESHARRIYGLALSDNLALCALARRIQSGDIKSIFTPRDVYSRHWRHLDKEGAESAIEELEALGWLSVQVVSTGGRPSTVCHVNPKVEISR